MRREVPRRRTFGIISHPDAGKTTLTEKLLLFGGAIQIAGAVKAKKAQRHATSDWMEVERERGISVSSSVMKFIYDDHVINLLDTPGHQDFSEDTYRVLTAVDSALMVIDSVKGVETQTRKLMEVCRLRDTPILTFINKLDREGRDAFDLLSDIEHTLGIQAAPMTWPIGMGKSFQGVYDIQQQTIRFFAEKGEKHSRPREAVVVRGLEDPRLDAFIGEDAAGQLRAEIELLDGAGFPFDKELYLQGKQTPVFFGSAVNSFGVQELLDTLVRLAPGPIPRMAQGPDGERRIDPMEEDFSGVVFKIQANMDPAHRDRIAFMRICSGRFERGMKVRHHRIDKEVQLSRAITFMAQDREGVEDAWPGDIIGLHNHGTLKIGDTLTTNEPLKFTGIPNFSPEHFRRVRLADPLRSKQLAKGLTQLAEEGAIQVFRPVFDSAYILGAVGVLQFDVIIARLKVEYGVEAVYEPSPISCARWVSSTDKAALEAFTSDQQANLAYDADECLAILLTSEWKLGRITEEWPQITFCSTRENK